MPRGALGQLCLLRHRPPRRAPLLSPLLQGVLLERAEEGGNVQRLTIAVDLAHACLVLRGAQGTTPDCLRSVNSLAEALAVLHRETGRLGPSLTASPAKQGGVASASSSPVRPPLAASPAKPPLPAAHGADALRLAVGLVQQCSSAQLREGLAILSVAAGSAHLCAAAITLGALEALVMAAATVVPSASMGMSELQPSLTVAVASLLDTAPPASFGAGRLVAILAALLQQSCANPLLLCRLLVALMQRADVRAEAMRQGLASTLADVYVRMSPQAAAAAAELLPRRRSTPPAAAGSGSATVQEERQRQQAPPLGFGSPLLPGGAAQSENQAAAGNGKRPLGAQVASLVATYNPMSDSGSDCSPCSSRSPSPTKVRWLMMGGGRLASCCWWCACLPDTVPHVRRAAPQAAASVRSPSALSGRFSVPRLALPTSESPTGAATGGLTRSTRRVLSTTPGARSPSPYSSPTRRSATCDSAEPSALAELATLASALGESLMAADLPAIVAHKRRADVRLASTEDDVPAGVHSRASHYELGSGVRAAAPTCAGVALPPHEPCPAAELLEPPPSSTAAAKKVLEGHRILVTARSLRSVDSSASRTTDAESALGGARTARLVVDVEQIKCLLLKALVAALPLLEPAGACCSDLRGGGQGCCAPQLPRALCR